MLISRLSVSSGKSSSCKIDSSNIENTASLRVIEKCEFKFEGNMRHACNKPTQEMLVDGYTNERTISYFSLIDEDKKGLSWYSDILKYIVINSKFKKKSF